MVRHYARSLVCMLGMGLTLVACDDNPTALESSSRAMARVAGEYSAEGNFGAISLTTEESGEAADWLELGASLKLRLTADGKTTGRLYIPGADEDGGDFEEDLTGSWTLSADTVRFQHEADTFIRDMPFAVKGDRLVGDKAFDSVRVRLEVARR